MKIWIRYLAGTVLGIIIGSVVPAAGGDSLQLAGDISLIVVRIARILTFPLAFFAMIIAADEIAEARIGLGTALRTVVLIAVTIILAVVVGAAAMLGFNPQRVPPMVQEGGIGETPNLLSMLAESLPANGFRLFIVGDGALGGLLLIALLIGWTLRGDREVTSPISLVADSANHIFYNLNTALTNLLGLGLIVPATLAALQVRAIEDLAVYGQLLLVVAVSAAVVGGVVFPALFFLVQRRRQGVLGWLFAMAGPVLAAGTTGDSYAALGTSLRVGREELGIPRRIGGSVMPIAAIVARAGTALVALSTFLLVVRSYTALDIAAADVIRLSLAAVVYATLLGRHSSDGVAVLLSWLAVLYGRGMEESWLILLPVMPLLARIAAMLDALTAGFIAHLVSVAGGHQRKSAEHEGDRRDYQRRGAS